jgi:hypothetical protein
MKVVLAYLLIGSYGLLFWQWRQRKMRTADPPLQCLQCNRELTQRNTALARREVATVHSWPARLFLLLLETPLKFLW